jgi:hypothetical protein
MPERLCFASSRSHHITNKKLLIIGTLAISACAAKPLWTINLTGIENSNRHLSESFHHDLSLDGNSYSLFQPIVNGDQPPVLQKHDSSGVKQWSVENVFFAFPGSKFEVTVNAEAQEQINLLDFNEEMGLRWEAYSGQTGDQLVNASFPTENFGSGLINANSHFASSNKLLVTSYSGQNSTAKPTELYEVTPDGVRLVFTSAHTASYVTINSDAEGNVYLLGRTSDKYNNVNVPAFSVKLSANYQLLWETELPQDAYVHDYFNGTDLKLASDGDSFFIEKEWQGGFRLRSIDGDTGALSQRTIENANYAEVLGTDDDGGAYVFITNDSAGGNQHVRIERTGSDLTTSVLIENTGKGRPRAKFDKRHGFLLSSEETKVLSQAGNIYTVSEQVSVEYYDSTGKLKKTMKGAPNVYTQADIYTNPSRYAISNEKTGESLHPAGFDSASGIYMIMLPLNHMTAQYQGDLDYSYYLRKY